MLALLLAAAVAQPPLHERLAALAAEARGKVYVSCALPGTPLDCDLDPHGHPPMQSTFKLPLAVAVLHQVELGKLQLDQPVRFRKADRAKTVSALQDEFPEADVDVPLRKVIERTVESSDNIGADLQLRLLGGPRAVQAYLDSLGLRQIRVRHSEAELHANEALQYQDFAEPAAMVALLRRLADDPPLTPEHAALLNQWLLATATGPQRLRGLLPQGTKVAHKTGSSGSMHGLIPATNDVGLITLPDGRRLALAVFVSDSHASQEACEHVIAAIAKAIYDEAIAAAK